VEGEHTAFLKEDTATHLLHDGEAETGGGDERKGTARGMHPCRRIVFELLSHDQGSSWDRAYHGTYAHSWTWVDVNLQRNVHADSQSKRHVVAWEWQDTVEEGSVRVLEAENLGRVWRSLDGELIRGLQYGDRIVLWMHARFPGWACYLSEARVTVYWAV